jgi:hypothetical protein
MAKAILRPRKRAKQRRFTPSAQTETEIEVAKILLRRAQDVLSALAFCADQEAELSLGPIAVTVRDMIDRVLDGLATLVLGRSDDQAG